ncbi:hypothetical protein Salat_0173600 [Sesamum alatum]|uniref:Uncharacterized protein n=1 Tax=Sesamum alatum TaxID=300844 RepID=A0AAE2CXR7_9LAMI|nr:hypothetical protein Salat_0173600 [Sesamum alatum]
MVSLQRLLLVTVLLIGLDGSLATAQGPAQRLDEVMVGKCRGLSDCLCPRRCKSKNCTPGQCFCRDEMGRQILVGNCTGDADCNCPRRLKDKFCTLGDCFCRDC